MSDRPDRTTPEPRAGQVWEAAVWELLSDSFTRVVVKVGPAPWTGETLVHFALVDAQSGRGQPRISRLDRDGWDAWVKSSSARLVKVAK